MNAKHIDALLNNVTADMATSFFISRGWVLDMNFPNKNLVVFIKSSEEFSESFEIVIPSSEKFSDFKIKLVHALNTLCELENELFDDLLAEICKQDVDLFQIRVTSQCAKDGTLPLQFAASLINSIKSMIVSSANSEESPRPYHPRSTQDALLFGNLFRLGQTDIGSYILRVETNSLRETATQLIIKENGEIGEEVPLQRRVITRVQKALHQIESYQHEENFDDFLKDAYITGINANMCDAILELEKNIDCPISFESKLKFSKLISPPADIPEKVTINSNDFVLLESISNAYKEHEDKEPYQIVGKVTTISTGKSLNRSIYEKDIKGFVTISFKYNGSSRSVRIFMENEEYQTACDALKEKKLVSINGVINKNNRVWTLENYHEFHILTEDEF